jgi:hypothetical protein
MIGTSVERNCEDSKALHTSRFSARTLVPDRFVGVRSVASTLPIASTVVSRFSTRTAISSPLGNNSATKLGLRRRG